MNVIQLTALDLAVAALLVVALAVVSHLMRLRLSGQLLLAAARTTIQLLLVGMLLKVIFERAQPSWLAAMATVMLFVSGYEVMRRQQRRLKGWWGFGVGTLSMFISSFSITFMALTVIVGNTPWYEPRYAIPLLGMMLGNTMTGVALGLDRLTLAAWQQRSVIEAKLILGQSARQAIADIRNQSIRGGLIPIINSMSIAGLVSLPGMMTGQILGGSPPQEAVRYQILIMFLIAAGTGFGTLVAVWAASLRLFDQRQRLRLERLTKARAPEA